MMRKFSRARVLILVISAVLLTFADCASKRETTEVLSADDAAPAQPTEKPFELKPAEEPVKKIPDPITVQTSHPMVPFRIGDRLLPDDFEIGSLQDANAADARDVGVLETLSTFTEKLLKSEIDADSFDGDKKTLLRNSLQYYVENQMVPKEIRFGTIRYDSQGSGYLAVRLLSEKGRSTGEIYIGRRGEKWYITDLQLDLETLSSEYVIGTEKYIPSRYRSVLRLF